MPALYRSFSPVELRNLAFYIAGIMCYKFSLETLTGCISQLALNRISSNPNTTWSTLQAINYASQCLGSLMVAPMVKRYTTGQVLSVSIWSFGITIATIPILEVLSGGTLSKSGSWNPYFLFAAYPIAGIFHGIVELIRRVIPQDIVGGDTEKLKKMDSTVHIFYEVAGTVGALLSRYWIDYFKFAYALSIIPIFFTISGALWLFLRLDQTATDSETPKNSSVVKPDPATTGIVDDIISLFRAFIYSIIVGARLVLTKRALIWLIPAYSLPLVIHRYLENVIFPQYAKYATPSGSYQQLLSGGSNLGELLGALFVLLFTNKIATPLPWLRLDALTLMIIWVFPLYQPSGMDIEMWIWILAGFMLFISWGWAAGDVTLVAYVQGRLSKMDDLDQNTSILGSVMSALYVFYIIIFAILSPIMGNIMDSYLGSNTKYPASSAPAKQGLFITAGVFITVSAGIILLATFIPKGSFKWNPKVMDEDDGLGCDNNEKVDKGEIQQWRSTWSSQREVWEIPPRIQSLKST